MTNYYYKNFRNAMMALLGGIMLCFTSCGDDDPEKSKACDIVTFAVGGESWTIDGTSITHTYPNGTDVTALAPTITVSPGATVSPASGAAKDFSAANGVTYWVTAEDGSTKKQYTAKATVAPPDASKDCDITAFAVSGVNWTISGANITHTYPAGTNVTALAPTITYSAKATVSPASGAAQDFSAAAGVTYTVTAEDGTTKKTYTAKATVEQAPPATGAEILSFTVNDEAWTIDGTNITHTYPAGTNVTSLTPTITLSESATVSPASGAAQDFSSTDGVTYTVTAADGETTNTYTVKAIVLGPVASGTTGDCTWTIYGEEGDYTLIISGNGAMDELGWEEFRDDNDAFPGITNIIVEDGVTVLGDWHFSNYPDLLSATLPTSVTTLSGGLFYKCSKLVSMAIPPNVDAIGYGSFFKCHALTSITIPVGVQEISEAAFADCINMETVICLNPIPPTLSGDGHFRFAVEDEPENREPFCILRVPAQSVDAYKTSPWGELAKFAEIVAIE